MTSTWQENGKSAILKIGTALSIYEAAGLRDELISHLENHEHLILELGEVQKCDAAGIQLLYSAWKTADTVGKTVTIRNPSSAILKIMKEMGVNSEEILSSEL